MLMHREYTTPLAPLLGAKSALIELVRRVYGALETYSNIHRGSGLNSEATTALFEQAREVVLEHLGLDRESHVVVFLSPYGARGLVSQLEPESYQLLSSDHVGLPLGVQALVIKRRALRDCAAPMLGGGTAKMVSPGSFIWSNLLERFEAGTPAIMNVITFAIALTLMKRHGKDCFHEESNTSQTARSILYQDELTSFSGVKLLAELRKAIVGAGVAGPVRSGRLPYVHLDHAASTPTFGPVFASVCQTWRSSRETRLELVAETKKICREFLGAPEEDYSIVFTSNTTEAINIVAKHLRRSNADGVEQLVLGTWLEHNSNELPWRATTTGEPLRLSVTDEGFVDLDELRQILDSFNGRREHGDKRIALVAISGASNVLGTYNDLRAIADIVHQYGARLLVDAAQLAAHHQIEMKEWRVDFLALSGHKLYAPFGCGILVVRNEVLASDPLTWARVAARGEENVTGIAALGKAMVLLQRVGMATVEAEERELTRRALRGLSQIQGIEVFGISDPDSAAMDRRGGIIAFSVRRVPHNRVTQELADRSAIGTRTGCHCAHLLVKRLLRIAPFRAKLADYGLKLFPKFTSKVLPGLVRVSFGIGNDEADIELFLSTLRDIAAVERPGAERFWAKTHNGAPCVGVTEVSRRREFFISARVSSTYPEHGVTTLSPWGKCPVRLEAIS